MNHEAFKNLISSRGDGLGPATLRSLLMLPALGYAAAVTMRNSMFNAGLLRTNRAARAVISIGNITAGGTGKTPLVAWLANTLHHRNISSAILTRGYKKKPGSIGDEPRLLADLCPTADVIVDSNRSRGAATAINDCDPQVLIMDDGFQHRALARDLDIVVIDALCPFGYGRILPAGLLREPLGQLKRADAIVISRCDMADSKTIDNIRSRIAQYNPHAAVALAKHCPVELTDLIGGRQSLAELEGRKIAAFCAIGNPQAFFDTLKSLGCDIAESIIFDDHHDYSEDDIRMLTSKAKDAGADMVITTAKDAVKIDPAWACEDGPRIWQLDIQIEIISGREMLEKLITETIDQFHTASAG